MFGIGYKILAIFGGSVAALLAVVLAVTVISKNATIHGLENSIHNPKTGYAARLQKATADLTQCRANGVTLSGALDRANGSIMQLKTLAEQRAEQAQLMLAELHKRRPANAALLERIDKAVAGSDACISTDQLILESLR